MNKWLTPHQEGDRPHPAAFSSRPFTVERARMFALAAHAAMGQKRKYTGEDYIVHPMEVAEEYFLDMVAHNIVPDDDVVVALINHDTIEDTRKFVDSQGNVLADPYKAIRAGHEVRMLEGITVEHLAREFGERAASFIDGLTEAAMPWDGNREARVEINIAHLAEQPAEVKTAKGYDIRHNLRNIGERDPNYAFRYYKEKRKFVERGMVGAQEFIRAELLDMIDRFLHRA